MAAFVDFSAPDSALAGAIDPDVWITRPVELLREVHHRLDVLAWQNTEDARKKNPQNFPERLPLTVAERAAAKEAEPLETESLALDAMRDWLGWSLPGTESDLDSGGNDSDSQQHNRDETTEGQHADGSDRVEVVESLHPNAGR